MMFLRERGRATPLGGAAQSLEPIGNLEVSLSAGDIVVGQLGGLEPMLTPNPTPGIRIHRQATVP